MDTLIERAKSDPSAFGELYEAHAEAVYHYIATRVNHRHDAEDLTAMVWDSVVHHIKNLETNKLLGFKAWLFKIARNTLNHYFNQKRSTSSHEISSTEEIVEQEPDKEPTPLESTARQEQISQLRKLIQALPPQQKEIVALHFFSELRNKEIAELLELSEKTVASNLSRALETLRSRFKKLQ